MGQSYIARSYNKIFSPVSRILQVSNNLRQRVTVFAIILTALMLALPQMATGQLPVTNDLVLHLDASELSLSDDDPVTSWTDLSDNDYHATQSTGDYQPTFKTNILNGNPVVRFDGTDDYLETTSFSSALSQPNTIFVVWQTNSTGTQFAIDGITTTDRNSIYQRSGEIAFYAGSTQEYTRDTPFDWLITTALFDGSGSEIWENGDSKATGNTGSQSLTGALIGSRVEYRNFLDGDIAEIIIYDRALSFSEQTDVEYYLSRKYGFSMSDAPVTDGLVLHLDAGALDLSNDASVAQWDDLSGFNNDAAQSTAANQPTYKTGILNGKPVVEFDGTDDYLLTDAFSSAISQPNTVFVVWKTNTTGTQFAIDGIASGSRHGIFQGTGGGNNVAFYAGSTQSYSKTTPFDAAIISSALFNGANSEVWENGESKLTQNLGSHNLTGITVGVRQGFSIGFLDGDIAEVLIYDRALTENERVQVELYLDGKYQVMDDWKEWTGSVTGSETDWDEADNWSPSGAPTSDNSVLIPSELDNYPTLNSTSEVKTIYIHSGAELTIGSSGDLTLNTSAILSDTLTNNGTLTISSGAFLTVKPEGFLDSSSGTLTNSAGVDKLLVESSSLETGSIFVNGTVAATVQRYVSGSKWHIVSSPVTNQDIQDFIDDSNISYSSANSWYAMTNYNENRNSGESGGWEDYYTSSTTGNMTQGEGYLTGRTGNGPLVFSGNLAYQTVSVDITRNANGWNALGNPFPSAIGVTSSASSTANFLDAYGNQLDPSYQALFIYDPAGSGGYKTINQVITGFGSIDQDYIQPGQGFIVKSKTGGGTVSFTPAMRINEKESRFYKKSAQDPWPFIQLQVSYRNRLTTTLIAFNSYMTRGLDPGYDAGQFGADQGFNLYTRLVEDDNEVNLSIQAVPDDGLEDLVIPVGFDFVEGGEVTFSAELLRLPTGGAAILEDREQGVFTDLENENFYTVTLDENSIGPGRFFIHTDIQITGVEDVIGEVGEDEQGVHIYSYGKEIFIEGEVFENTRATVYDMVGRKMKEVILQPSDMNLFRVDELDKGIYLIRVSGAGINKSGRVFID